MVKNNFLTILLVSLTIYGNSKQGDNSQIVVIDNRTNAEEAYNGFVHPGLFLFRASIAVGGMTSYKAGSAYIEGDMEYFIDRRVSLRGDGYYFMTHTSDYKPFKFNHSLFTGAMFHKFTKGDFDPYAGIEVGINYAQATDAVLGKDAIAIVPPESVQSTFAPLFSQVVGFNYYGGKFFHLTVHARYVMGRFMDNYNSASLNEWRISFGLGFNLSKKILKAK